jgi:PAS domain S-box-containing protein
MGVRGALMPFLEVEIFRAIEQGQFIPYFQPLVDLREGDIRGFEVLARWRHPTLGLLSPSEFIPLAEQYRLVNSLSMSLFKQAFAAMRIVPAGIGLSVNLSSGQLHDRSLPALLHRLADEAGFDLRRLTVEITESALLDNLDVASLTAGDLKALGIRLALDDFGTGYSSLLHLQALPFDELKVDMSFVRSMVESRQSRKITAAVISLGLSLGLQTVAEGIEDRGQANLLIWQGCNLGQGWLYGRPQPAENLPAMLAQPPHAIPAATSSVADPSVALDAHPAERLSQLRAIYDSAPVGLCFLDRELRYVNINQRLAQMNELSPEAHLGRKVADVMPQIYAQIEPYLLRALKGEACPGVEVPKPPAVPGDPIKTMLRSFEPVRDEAGEVIGVCVSVADITVVKQNEEALRESADHYRHSVALNPQSPWVTDAQGHNLAVNSSWQALTGLAPDRAKDFGWLDAVHPQDRERAIECVRQSIDTGRPLDVEYRVYGADGSSRSMRSRGEARRNSQGEITRWDGSVECIDDPKSPHSH